MPTNWNDYQKTIFDAVRNPDGGNLVVKARAGTGKTTTILEALRHTGGGSAMLCAFNKRIQKELEERAPSHVSVKTLHAIGFGILGRHFGFENLSVDGNCTRQLVRELTKKDDRVQWDRARLVSKLVSLAKNTLTSGVFDLTMLAKQFWLDEDGHPAEALAAQAQQVLLAQNDDESGVIDFDDMLWRPAIWGLNPRTFDWVFVDEAQDLNAAQRWLVEAMLDEGSRLCAVGDDRQAIYGWRGAGKDVIGALSQDFAADLLPLSITYRCPKKVVRLVNEWVPDYECHEEAPEGTVETIAYDTMLDRIKPGCFVLSRLNAPLMHLCLELLQRDVPATIAGKDIGMRLKGLIDKSKTDSVVDLLSWLDQLVQETRVKYALDEQRIKATEDQVAALSALTQGLSACHQVRGRIEKLFTDRDDHSMVVLSTVHKAKGLERPTVYLLEETFNQGHGHDEEDNIFYVAATRTQNQLFFVR